MKILSRGRDISIYISKWVYRISPRNVELNKWTYSSFYMKEMKMDALVHCLLWYHLVTYWNSILGRWRKIKNYISIFSIFAFDYIRKTKVVLFPEFHERNNSPVELIATSWLGIGNLGKKGVIRNFWFFLQLDLRSPKKTPFSFTLISKS